MSQAHEIKGSAFVTLREWVIRERGEQAAERLVEAMPAASRDAFAEPLASRWHPEEVHRDVLRALLSSLCEGDFRRYHAVILGATELGIHKFARVVLQMTSAGFVIRRFPTLWRVIRRGPATLDVSQQGLVSTVTYAHFPYFEDLLYRRYLVAMLLGIVKSSAGYAPSIEIVDPTPERLVVEITLR